MPPLAAEIHACRACGSERIPEVLNLGDFALSDFLEAADAHTDRAPLVLVRCEACTLVQLRHTVDRDRLYERYWYRSGTQPAMVRALQDVVDEATRRVSLRPGDIALDIGANDGTLLRMYPESVLRIGVEPSETFDRPDDVFWFRNYWPDVRLVTNSAKIITSIACFYDVEDPGAFVKGIAANLAADGVWVNQMAYLPDTLAANNFGDICHEHLTYWTVQSFAALLGDHGLYLNDYSFNDVNGGSIRTIVSRTPVIKQRKDAPSRFDFRWFGQRVNESAYDVVQAIYKASSDEKTVVGYGASTKGNTYLQRWQIGSGMLPYIADRNPDKWGKYTPTGQKVISEEEMRAMRPDYLLVLPWHFLDAFMDRERDLLDQGTKFIVPFPTLRVIGGSHADLQPASAPSRVLAET